MNIGNFWNNKKVLITGHTGFKGMWLTLVLKSFNASVTGISNKSVGSDIYRVLETDKYFNSEHFFDVSSDISNENKSIFSENEFDVIFHFAAQAVVSKAAVDPLTTLKTNVIGTFQVIDLSIKNEASNCIVVATTDKVYKNSSDLNNEESQLGGAEFYSSSKVAAENVIESFKNSPENTSTSISTVRSGNVLGPGDGASDRLMTDLTNSLKEGKDIILRNPNSIRPWQDILDSIYGYMLVAELNYTKKQADIFNLNSEINNEITTKEIAQKMIEKWESNINIIESKDNAFYEAAKLRLDSTKANKILNWKSKLNIDQTIEKIVDWENANDSSEAEKISFDQIDKFFQS